ncbi:uncharacterized protein LOC117589503 [Drosophila guanche]|uniref:Solute carrier family 3 member 2 N-terminal domain-containing protein n=1 Tax=Drosophila guanche TaxID=7266 RepID=A0A3B0K0D1_DROGU|nr:uncharacterized protein LOC117589503 [Drosophila guanche]SPP87765.1 Hypothetical predicted protein [Drosophila guanche]
MSCDERTALLASQQGHQQQHIIVVPKDPKDYEPIFTTADYSFGLTLDELLPFALDPWWQSVRRLCSFCLGFIFLLTLCTALVLAHHSNDGCRSNRAISTTGTTTNNATAYPFPLSGPVALASNGTQLLLASL